MNNFSWQQPIDRAALVMMGILTTAIAILVGGNFACNQNDHCWFSNRPKVVNFSWQDQEVGATDKAFIMTFDRPMDHSTVEKNLVINPPLPGKMSWAGRRLAYTLDKTIRYGEQYQIQLSDAKEHFYGNKTEGQKVQPFRSQFQSRDRAFAYIGTEGEETGRIIYYNLSQQQKTILTPANLTVTDFKFYDQGQSILFSAADSNLGFAGLRELKLYQIALSENKT
ncbi:MAG: Ig-like domain-containing protein, partial [Microcystaceae cyanobacterium]